MGVTCSSNFNEVNVDDAELEKKSQALLRSMIANIKGSDMEYRPEELGSSMLQLIVPYQRPKTISDAVGYYNASLGEDQTHFLDASVGNSAVRRVIKLFYPDYDLLISKEAPSEPSSRLK